ncbi:uncharacterized protein LOC126778723 [Nymphalis io]|uniref:uncharacterized protein LOC126778723 n=1 Tax=Inachis io TaxID=171585 RepID=UPI0021674516|nr:uncharacterized protein LOC126778723 [Nymphalis io]
MPIGKLEPFDVNSKQWPAYIRRVKQYIVLNEIKEELHVPLLITVVGEATYALMCDLCSPALPETKNFDQLVKLLSDHLEPQRSEIAERHVFRLRRQRPGEPLMDYLHNLKHLATTCNFGSTLEENLRDQFVSGLVNEVMRSRIFAERNIKFKEAVELALALEAAEKHAEVSGATSVPTTASCAGGEGAEALHQASDRRGPARRPSAVAGGGARARGRRDADEVRCWRYASASEDEDFFNIELAAKDKLGTCKKTIQLHLTDKEPVYVRARPVPLALRGRVENELERLEREGYTYRVDHSEYGTPIVPVVKECGEIRICGDYKITINPKLKRDYYPLPRIEELFAALSGGDKVLAHYEEGRPLVLSVDSSAYGLGAVLAHRYPDGSERPVSCVSRTLNSAEINYSQLDKEADIENLCRNCEACRMVRDAPPRATLHPWEFPLHPWQRLHADFAECAGKKYLILIDAHSKWLEVHISTAPYRPQGNGAAENAYRNCENATTGVSPAVALLGRRLRGRLDALRPNVSKVVESVQDRQVANKMGSTRQIKVGDDVMVRDYTKNGTKWTGGTVTGQSGPVSYKVDVGDGVTWRRHHDQVINLNKKDRFSLSRTNQHGSVINKGKNEIENVNGSGSADSEAEEERFEDAAGEAEDSGPETRSLSPGPRPPTPPPPNATARDLRAYNRRIKKHC